jgi:predicted metalloprotease
MQGGCYIKQSQEILNKDLMVTAGQVDCFAGIYSRFFTLLVRKKSS